MDMDRLPAGSILPRCPADIAPLRFRRMGMPTFSPDLSGFLVAGRWRRSRRKAGIASALRCGPHPMPHAEEKHGRPQLRQNEPALRAACHNPHGRRLMSNNETDRQTSLRPPPGHPHPGASTAFPGNVRYRLSKIKAMGILKGVWLDCGCADGGYTEALVRWGVERAIGVDPDPERISMAMSKRSSDRTEYFCSSATLPFPDMSFDGVLLNEVLEHVEDETATLGEIKRVLRPGGHLVVMSPNRWFPFEGHGMHLFGRELGFPIPLLPWLPKSLSMPLMEARNYWPGELRDLVAAAGLDIISVDYVLPVLEAYPWLPSAAIRLYSRSIPAIEKTPLRRFGVSTLIRAVRRGPARPEA